MRPEHAVERLLNHYSYIRVLKTLATSTRPLTAYMLVKHTGVNRAKVAEILKVFGSHGWVVKTPYRPTAYSLNTAKQEVRKLVDLLTDMGYLTPR